MITVVYSFDRNYAHYAAVSTYSLALHSRSALRIVWVIPADDLEHIAPVAANLEVEVELRPVEPGEFSAWKASHHFSQAMYLRLLIPSLIHEPRAIYLDADTLVLSDLAALHAVDLGNNLLAGVPDPAGAQSSRVPRQCGDPYLNSGMLLMNLDALRNDNMLEKAKAIYCEYENELAWPDQCVINKYAEGRKITLDVKWNRQISAFDITEAQFDSVLSESGLAVLHFVDSVKPWHKWCNPSVGDFYWRYADRARIDGLKPQEITTIDQAMLFARVLDHNARFQEASMLKQRIIESLLGSQDSDSIA
ncbi:glycosyltransferase family 8 protein [Caballeronia sp. BR00000012568055]|uniref:glycosyltransferase family 8 protein n=1 Tax=Caballeronia sp. BR00000012568055 TaxID=2918761 RepID=UPI0023F95273|nr:glycosyltransferase family 8 protein [Caballeronia sp. BR00000012568055]